MPNPPDIWAEISAEPSEFRRDEPATSIHSSPDRRAVWEGGGDPDDPGNYSPRHVLPAFGLPYARAGVDSGGYHVICPVDGQRFYGSGSTEDDITKSAMSAYGEHFTEAAEREDL